MASWRRITGVAGVAAGAVAAGTGAVLAVEKIAVGRIGCGPTRRRTSRSASCADGR